jgi:chromosome partitioning protein
MGERNMKTIALANMKGGTGKTSISVSLAAELAKTSQTALLDFDPQGNTTAWMAPDDADMKYELADVLSGKVKPADAFIPTETSGLILLPTFGIAGDLGNYDENTGEMKISNAVQDLLDDIARQGYEYCVIDLSPAFGKLERAALIASREAITPIMADRFSLDGLRAISAKFEDLKHMARRPIAEYKRIVVNGLNRSIKRHAEITTAVKQGYKQKVYTLPIDQVFFRAQTSSRTIQDMDAKKETLDEFTRLANDIRGVTKG